MFAYCCYSPIFLSLTEKRWLSISHSCGVVRIGREYDSCCAREITVTVTEFGGRLNAVYSWCMESWIVCCVFRCNWLIICGWYCAVGSALCVVDTSNIIAELILLPVFPPTQTGNLRRGGKPRIRPHEIAQCIPMTTSKNLMHFNDHIK